MTRLAALHRRRRGPWPAKTAKNCQWFSMGRIVIVDCGAVQRKLFRVFMEIRKTTKTKQEPHWTPADCESCNAPFDPVTWQSDWSLSGELTWTCPKCHHPNYPRLD
jgi:hypothetical protein